MRKVSIDNLSQYFDLIIKKLKDENIREVELNDDFYRFIPADQWTRFDFDEILTGSLFDDIDSLNCLLSNPDQIVTYIDFDRTASILHALSEKLNPVSGNI